MYRTPIEHVNQESLTSMFYEEGDRVQVHTTSGERYRIRLTEIEETFLKGTGTKGTIKIPYSLVGRIEKLDKKRSVTPEKVIILILLVGGIIVGISSWSIMGA